MDIPAAAIGAMLVVSAVHWAWAKEGRNLWRWGLVVGLAALAVWRISRMEWGPLTAVDVMLGILVGLLLFNALKTAWADGPFEKPEPKRENTPLLVLLFAGFLVVVFITYSFGCLGLLVCEPNGERWLAWEYPSSNDVTALPPGGVHVDTLPPGFE